MRKSIALPLIVLIGLGLLQLGPAAGAAPPPPGNCGDLAQKPRVAFAVLGDGFTESQQGLLERASAALVCGGAMLNEPVYKGHPSQLFAETVHVTSPSTTIARPGTAPASALEIVYNGSRRDCFFTTSATAQKKIANAAAAALHRQVLVIVNLPNQDAGCTEGAITYITRGASWETISHEIGHILGLRDEYVDLEGEDPSILNRTNCSSTTPGWWVGAQIPGAGAHKGCNRYPKVFRAYQNCRMRTLDQDFCRVCEYLIREQLAPPTPPSGTPSVGPGVQLALRLTRSGLVDVLGPPVSIIASNDAPQVSTVVPAAVAGSHLSAVFVDGQVVSVTDVSRSFSPSGQLVRRAYGGTAPQMHEDRPAQQITVMAAVPQMTKAMLRGRQVDVRVVRLSTTPPPVMTTQFLNGPGVTTVLASTSLQTQIQ